MPKVVSSNTALKCLESENAFRVTFIPGKTIVVVVCEVIWIVDTEVSEAVLLLHKYH